jgi:hypothetical protein
MATTKEATKFPMTRKRFLSKADVLRVSISRAGADDAEVETKPGQEFSSGNLGWYIPWTPVTLIVDGRPVECTFSGNIVVRGSKGVK